ncbi:GNAT family N-acetyltransferase [Cohnella cellulosilytica]|uniref:GNAT family N-acetyltransferase n=1 Tax=Cohnella cellulosilytica TaxID=986710 RepID=A0ABW2FCQ2_9BACL
MVEYRQLSHADDLDEAVRLADRVFRDHEQTSMGQAFPFIFRPDFGQSFGAFEEGKLVSFIGLVPWLVNIGGARLQAYAIGAVCTDPDYRGKGYAGTMLDLIKDHIRQAGASLLLISGDRSLYTRNHCYHFGSFNRYTLLPENAEAIAARSAVEGYTVREFASRDWYALHALAESRTVRYEQSLTDLAQLIHSQAVASNCKHELRTLIAEQGGKLAAFAVVTVPGRYGTSAAPQAPEWAGEAKAVAAIFADAVKRYALEKLEASVSWHETELRQALPDAPSQARRNGGTVFISDPQALLEQAAPYWNGAVDVQSGELRVTKSEEGRYTLHLGRDEIVLTPQELVSVLFDPAPTLTVQPPADVQERLAALFPLPFPYTEGLNFI